MSDPRRAWPGPDQLLLRSVVVLATLVVLASALAADARPHPVLALGLFGLAVLAACLPESSAGLGLLVGCGYLWTRVPESLSAWVLVAAAAMVAAHSATLVAAQGPPRMAVDTAQVRIWSLRSLFLWVTAVVVWAIARVIDRMPDEGAEHRLVFGGGLVVLGLLAVVAARQLGARSRPS